jgi:SAM-dependent MidA family methyltransferase
MVSRAGRSAGELVVISLVPVRAGYRTSKGYGVIVERGPAVPLARGTRRTVPDVADGWRRWRDAMQDALYGPSGFYVRPAAPFNNFRTAAQVGATWSRAIAELAHRVDVALGEPANFAFVDIGAGGGDLLNLIAPAAPDRWSLIGVDLAPRPDDLSPSIQWLDAPPPKTTGLLFASEWLDVVPLDVVELAEDGPRYVEVQLGHEQRLGGPVTADDRAWLDRWWPLREVGDCAEIGSSRDEAWSAACATLSAGLAVMVDYATDPVLHRGGTLTAYADGEQVAPIPDGARDLTAHVLVESLTSAGDLVVHQHEALARLGSTTKRSAYAGDSTAHLMELRTASEVAELVDRNGLGGFTWLLHGRGCEPASVLQGQ